MNHENEKSPVANSVSSNTRASLRKFRKESRAAEKSIDDDMYIIESIHEIKTIEDQTRYKVKWFNFPEEACTWETDENIPRFIINYYSSDTSRLGIQLPNPRIKHTKTTLAGTKYHFLSWDGERGGQWLGEDFFQLASDNEQMNFSDLSCQTRKSRDKRICRWNVGLFVGAFHCGTVCFWDELFISESISQVYGIFIEFLTQLPESTWRKIKHLFYDDNCHLSKFALNNVKKCDNMYTRFFAYDQIKVIDKFHFINHVDQWCIDNCDPYKIDALKNSNSEICEQLFNRVNRHTNCKSMNESRYFLFWLILFDLHNLEIMKLTMAADPRRTYRWENITIHPVDLSRFRQKNNVENLSKDLEVLDINNCNDNKFLCNECDSSFSSSGFLDQHKFKKHGHVIKSFVCNECEKILQSKRNLDQHILKMHRICRICGLEFKSKVELDKHKRCHTTCEKCFMYFSTKYNFDRHMLTHKA